MKLALFNDYAPGLVVDDRVVVFRELVGDAVMAQPPHRRMAWLITHIEALRGPIESVRDGEGEPLESVRLRAPLPHPQKMLFAQGNYRENEPTGSRPQNMFLKSPSSILDPGGTVVLTSDDAAIFHHEAELAVVIGRRAKNVPAEDALAHVFGYSTLVDVSARCVGRGQDLADKSPDTFCPLGPWIVTRDEIPDPQNLSVKLWVDGRLRQDYSTADMEYSVASVISWASEVLTLEPGDVIGCGTNHQGLGPLQDGESFSIEISGVGRMDLRVADPLRRRWPVGIDENLAKAVVQLRTTGIRPPPSEMFSMRRIRCQ